MCRRDSVHTVLVQIIIVKVVSSVHILRALVLRIVRKVVSVNIVPAQTISAKGVSSVLILRVPVLTAVKGVNSVLTLRVLVPAVIIKAVTVLIAVSYTHLDVYKRQVSVILYRQGLKTGLSLCVKIYFCMKNCRSFSDK